VTFVANTLFRERYITLPMHFGAREEGELLTVGYSWKYRGHWNQLSAKASAGPVPLQAGSKEELITEHFWGYAGRGQRQAI